MQNAHKFQLTSKNETRIPIVDNKIHQTASEKKLEFSASLTGEGYFMAYGHNAHVFRDTRGRLVPSKILCASYFLKYGETQPGYDVTVIINTL
jgi:hypothetical protein